MIIASLGNKRNMLHDGDQKELFSAVTEGEMSMIQYFKKLFEPVQIGTVEIKNRIAMAPMGTLGLLNPDGSPSQRASDYYIERALGGVGLIITGMFRVNVEIEPFLPIVALITRTGIAAFSELAEVLHSLGTKIFVQLSAGSGRVANPQRLSSHPVSASAIPNYWVPDITCRELRTEEVEKLVSSFGSAAHFLKSAGIDGIELHGHEGYLFDQFATSLWNKRTDKYGGDLSSRLRFATEVLEDIKRNAGPHYPVQYRFGLKHYVKGYLDGALPGEQFLETGRDICEGLEMAKFLEAAGFDALHVDAGCYDSWYWPHPPIYQDYRCMIEMAAKVKKYVHIPVIAVGKMGIPELAEDAISQGKADIIALGRSLLADPYWVKKVAQGKPETIRPCIGCYDGCMGRMLKGKPLSCAVNPAAGRERFYGIEPTKKPQNVLIVGGGVAGMEAARVATLRGHHVTLYEKSDSLGGHLIEASVPSFKKDLCRLLEWYKNQLGILPLEIRLGKEFCVDMVGSEKPDILIIASGSRPIIPDIPGISKNTTLPAVDILLNIKTTIGEPVVILGGGVIGCETALWLSQQGIKVTIIEIMSEILNSRIQIQHMNRLMLLNLLKSNRVKVLTNTSIIEIHADYVVTINKSLERNSYPASTVVWALGLAPEQSLYRSLLGKFENLYLIGDSKHPQNVLNAVWDAYHVARLI